MIESIYNIKAADVLERCALENHEKRLKKEKLDGIRMGSALPPRAHTSMINSKLEKSHSPTSNHRDHANHSVSSTEYSPAINNKSFDGRQTATNKSVLSNVNMVTG